MAPRLKLTQAQRDAGTHLRCGPAPAQHPPAQPSIWAGVGPALSLPPLPTHHTGPRGPCSGGHTSVTEPTAKLSSGSASRPGWRVGPGVRARPAGTARTGPFPASASSSLTLKGRCERSHLRAREDGSLQSSDRSPEAPPHCEAPNAPLPLEKVATTSCLVIAASTPTPDILPWSVTLDSPGQAAVALRPSPLGSSSLLSPVIGCPPGCGLGEQEGRDECLGVPGGAAA